MPLAEAEDAVTFH